MAVVGLISGIAATVLSFVGAIAINDLWFLCLVGLPLAIVGMVLSIVAKKKLQTQNQPTGVALAGMIVGIVATVLTAILFFACGMPALWLVVNLG